MSFKTPLCRSLIITIVTQILDAFMFRLNMFLKITLGRSLIITIVTRILDTFMFRLNMYLKTYLVVCLIITIVTEILDAFMFISVMFQHNISMSKLFSTLWTLGRLSINFFLFIIQNSFLRNIFLFIRHPHTLADLFHFQIFCNFDKLCHSLIVEFSLSKIHEL